MTKINIVLHEIQVVKLEAAILDRVRSKFDEQAEFISQHSKPWAPWALVELLDIVDEGCPLPAEIILYRALEAGSKKCRIGRQHVVVQENFVNQTGAGVIRWRNGDIFPGKYPRYMMEHVGSRKGQICHQISAGKMWDFLTSVHPKDLGVIRHYIKTKYVSRRMKVLCKQIVKNFPHMLTEIPVELRNSAEKIARWLVRLAKVKQLHVNAYIEEVNKSKVLNKKKKRKQVAGSSSAAASSAAAASSCTDPFVQAALNDVAALKVALKKEKRRAYKREHKLKTQARALRTKVRLFVCIFFLFTCVFACS